MTFHNQQHNVAQLSLWARGLDSPATVRLVHKEPSPFVLRRMNRGGTIAGRVLPREDAMAEPLELKPAAAPATVLESEDTGRERWVRGFYLGDSWHGRRGLATAAAAAMATATWSSWGARLR